MATYISPSARSLICHCPLSCLGNAFAPYTYTHTQRTSKPYQGIKKNRIRGRACALVAGVIIAVILSGLQGQVSPDHCRRQTTRTAVDLPLTVELQPLSIQQSSPPRRVRVPLSATSGSSSSSPVYIRDPVDWSTRPDVLARHRQYKAADFRSSADKRRYKTERRQRKVVKAYQTRTYAPRGLTIESHQHLAPVARRWHGSATQ